MAFDLTALRAALAATQTSIGVYPYSDIPSNPEFPAAYAGLPDRLSDFSSGGTCTVEIALVLVVSRADESTAQTELSALLSPAIAALFAAPCVEWEDIALVDVGNFRASIFGEANCLAVDVNLSLRTT